MRYDMNRCATLALGVMLALGGSVAAQQPSGQEGQTGTRGTRSGERQSTGAQSGQQGSTAGQSEERGATAGRQGSMSGQGQLSATDRKFVTQAAKDSMMEVELSKVASEKATSDDVKQFAERMVKDHTATHEKVTQLAQQKGVDLEQEMDAKHKRTIDQLSAMSGEQFDRAYMRHMQQAHRNDIREFERASKRSTDSDIKQFATETLPTLREHRQMAQTISGQGRAADAATTGEAGERRSREKEREPGTTEREKQQQQPPRNPNQY